MQAWFGAWKQISRKVKEKETLRAGGAGEVDRGRFQHGDWDLRKTAGAAGLGGSLQGLLPGPEHKQQWDPGLWRIHGCARPWRAHSLQSMVWQLGMRKSSSRIRKRCEPLDLVNPVSEVDDAGEDTGVDGVPAVQTPAGQPHQNPGTEEITDERAPGVTLGKRGELGDDGFWPCRTCEPPLSRSHLGDPL